MSKKPIIVFEGIEGSGKSYHINNVARYLKKKKSILYKLESLVAARSENIDVIKKNLGKKIILIDRFVDSTMAYQHYGMGVDINFIRMINNFLLKGINVNFTFLNIVNPNNMKKRLSKRKTLNRYDKFDQIFYKRVQLGFLKISKKNPKKYMKIDSNLDIIKNKKIILNKIDTLI